MGDCDNPRPRGWAPGSTPGPETCGFLWVRNACHSTTGKKSRVSATRSSILLWIPPTDKEEWKRGGKGEEGVLQR